jgi:hypothetical protein
VLYGSGVRVGLGCVLAASASLLGCGGADPSSPDLVDAGPGARSDAGSGADAAPAGRTRDAGAADGASDGASDGGGASGGGASGGGASGGGASGGGASGGGASGGGASGGGASGGGTRCKRGIASNAAPSAAFARSGADSPGIAWWYNWAAQATGGDSSIEFVPMIWGSGSLTATVPAASEFVLGFNEPNFKAQADLTTAQAAMDWPAVERIAGTTMPRAAELVSPAVNFCGSASDASQCSDPAVTDPYTYLTDFFAACAGCNVDYVAVHWYNCDLPSLQAYIDGSSGSGGLAGFVQFGKPIWLTEFSCDSSHSVADQLAYMQVAIPYLESNPHIYRYAWFSASGIPNAELANADGSLTDLGAAYVALPASCP